MLPSDFHMAAYDQGLMIVQILCADCGTDLTAALDAVQVESEDARGATTVQWICTPCADAEHSA